MVYGRQYDGRELNFEASGALLEASLVMRDRETDSWWSIMSGDAIGGDLEGTVLTELPVGEKTTWREWRERHPDTVVLSVRGQEHVANNPYDNYFRSDGTFRNVQVDDRRLPAKEPIFTFRLGDTPYAIPHRSFAGGALIEVGARHFLLYRRPGASIFASTEAWEVSAEELAEGRQPERLLELGRGGDLEPLSGFDTFWYNWVAVNRHTELLEAQ